MLNNWFPGIFQGSNDGKNGSAITVGNPTRIEGNARERIKELYALPVTATAQGVLDAAYQEGEEKAASYLHAKLSRHNLKRLQSRAEIFKNQLAYSKEAMKVEEELQRELAQHGEAVTRFAFGHAEKSTQLDGYTQTFNQVGQVFEGW